MSYTTINGMRSARYPLQGAKSLGCGYGCGGKGSCGIGQNADVERAKTSALSVVLIGLGAGFLWAVSTGKRRR